MGHHPQNAMKIPAELRQHVVRAIDDDGVAEIIAEQYRPDQPPRGNGRDGEQHERHGDHGG